MFPVLNTIILLSALSLFTTIAGAADTSMEECAACHPDFKHQKVTITAKDRCIICHGDTEGHETRAKKTDATAEPALIDLQAGMSLPLTYEKSMRGSEPNPMIEVPAGEFIMGTDGRLPDEGPQHVASTSAYLIDKFEVTNKQYKAFIDATGRRSPKLFRNRTYPEGKADHPVVYVSWKDADAYCRWAGKRLPTEQEWEKAARGTDGRFFPWGNEFDVTKANTPQRWAAAGMEGDTTPVGAFEEGKSAFGLYDMSGNVWEWTASWYQAHPGNTHHTENYGEKYKVLKGGSWWDCSFYKCGISAPVYNRSFFLRSTKNSSFGFRCAKDK